jgi:L-histidine Nalpha-methyltransferase
MIAHETIPVPSYAAEIIDGLTAPHKTLPCKLFYDEIGSALFEEITGLPEYYPTRTELEILRKYSREIALAAGCPISVVELGAGTATKTEMLLRALAGRQMRVKFFPVDISPSALAAAKKRLRAELPGALVRPVIADFSDGFHFLREISGRKLVLYLGSSIGNFDWNDAIALLRKVRDQLCPGDALLLGTDMVKSPEILVPAYDDAQGVTAEFNKNILRRINREFRGDFDLDSFRHVAEWNAVCSRMEIYLESCKPQVVTLAATGATVRFRAGERIHTENSNKYIPEMVRQLLCVSGFRLEKSWFDDREWFGLHLARV